MPAPLPRRELLGDARQYASVRRIVLDDGPERGVRALAFSTGGGLDFWVLCDRSFDIGPLWWQGVQLGWQSPAGFKSPALNERWDDGGRGMERGFSGMLVTCGLDHVRRNAGSLPLHGHLPYTPGRLLAYGEDWDREQPILYARAEMTQFRLNGEALRLTRSVEAPIGDAVVRILDVIENIGPAPQEIAILYHVNPGYPLVDAGTTVELNGRRILGPVTAPADDTPASTWQRVVGEAAVVIVAGPTSPVRLEISFSPETLPCLQIWQNLQPNVGMLGIEPCLPAPDAPKPILAPGETRRFPVALRLAPTRRTEP